MWDSLVKHWALITGVVGTVAAVTVGVLKAIKDTLTIKELLLKIENLERGLQNAGVVLPATVDDYEEALKRKRLFDKINSGALNTVLVLGVGMALFGLYLSGRDKTPEEVVVRNLLQEELFLTELAAAAQEATSRLKIYTAVPAGTILSYGGQEAPDGWLPCDGRSLLRDDHKILFTAIETSWGDGDEPGRTFNLPDLAGYFLRGRTDSTERDPEVKTRASLRSGGATGSRVGSYQRDDVEQHEHELHQTGLRRQDRIGLSARRVQEGVAFPAFTRTVEREVSGAGEIIATTVRGDGSHLETRPKNAYVLFIIKAQ